MAGTNMTLDYQQMRDVAGRIGGEADPLAQLVSRMQSHIQALRGVWDSTAAQEFENTWNSIRPSLDRLHTELIPNISMQINTAASNYEAADNAAAAAARGY